MGALALMRHLRWEPEKYLDNCNLDEQGGDVVVKWKPESIRWIKKILEIGENKWKTKKMQGEMNVWIFVGSGLFVVGFVCFFTFLAT